MSESIILMEQLHEELSTFKQLPQIPWHQTNRAALIERLKEWHRHTKRAREIISLLQLEQLKNPGMKSINLGELEKELKKNMDVLHRNIQFEQDKNSRKIDLTEKVTTPELGMELDSRMHQQWLRLQRAQEHVQIALRKTMEDPVSLKSMEGEMFSLIKTKEEELQSLKKERDQLKREKFWGSHEKYSLTEMENELQDLLQTFAIQKHALKDHLETGKKKLDEYSVQHEHLHHKTMKLEHLVHELTKKHIDILTVLKKERDFARKLAMELESETAHMRAMYSKELLTLEEKKHALKQEAFEKHAAQISELQRRLKEQEHVNKEFEAMLREKERQIQRMAEQLPQTEREKVRKKNSSSMVS